METTLNYEFEIHAPWTLGDNSDYDEICWSIIFEEEGIEDEDQDKPISEEEMLDALIEGFEMTEEEYAYKFDKFKELYD